MCAVENTQAVAQRGCGLQLVAGERTSAAGEQE